MTRVSQRLSFQHELPPDPGYLWARLKYWAWKLVTFVVLAPIYVSVIAEGLRTLVPALSQKLCKLPIPGFSNFGHYHDTRRLDLAMFMAICLLVTVWWLWEQILHVLLSTEETLYQSGWKPDTYKRVVVTLGLVILGADAALFYSATAQLSWGGSSLSFPALFATAAYLAIIVFVSLISLKLRQPIEGR